MKALIAWLRDLPRDAKAVLARIVGLPVCDACDDVYLGNMRDAYAAGWRAQTGGVAPDFWEVRCPDCQAQDCDDPRWM